MIALRTADDWATATTTLNSGAGAQVYTYVSGASAYDAMIGLIAFADANVAASAPFGWTWTRNATDDGATLALTSLVACTMVNNAAAQTLTGFAASYGSGTTHTGTASAAGTWAPQARVGVRGYYRHEDGSSNVGGTGATRGGVPGSAVFLPTVTTIADAGSIARFTAQLAGASNPREAWIWQAHVAAWRRVAVGAVSHSRIGGLLHTVSVDVRGVE